MELVRYWRLNAQRYTLQGSVCTVCGKAHVAQRPVCDVCGASIRELPIDEQSAGQAMPVVSQLAAK